MAIVSAGCNHQVQAMAARKPPELGIKIVCGAVGPLLTVSPSHDVDSSVRRKFRLVKKSRHWEILKTESLPKASSRS
jgi:hypothetical protein